jgi:hypothetical protein
MNTRGMTPPFINENCLLSKKTPASAKVIRLSATADGFNLSTKDRDFLQE